MYDQRAGADAYLSGVWSAEIVARIQLGEVDDARFIADEVLWFALTALRRGACGSD